MRNLFKSWIKAVLCIALILAAAACGRAYRGSPISAAARSAGGEYLMSDSGENLAGDYRREAGGATDESSPETAIPVDTRKLVYEASLRLRVTDLEEAEKPVQIC